MDLRDLRRLYARQMLAAAGAGGDTRLEDAFAAVARERFLGQGAWQILTPWSPSVTLPDHDPALIYQDVVVTLDRGRGVNNGSPALHAHWMHAIAPGPGETVAHLGAGAGYYSALLTELVGEDGHVTAVEFDADLAARARANLGDRDNVTVVHADARDWPRRPVDVVYVNFAVARPASAWIEGLRPGGRLIFPLGTPEDNPHAGGRVAMQAVALLVTRSGGSFAARVLSPVSFVFAEGTRSDASQAELQALDKCLKAKGWEAVRSLVWGAPPNPARCWFAGADWGLSFDEIPPRAPCD